jgi:predicted aminopeptidase
MISYYRTLLIVLLFAACSWIHPTPSVCPNQWCVAIAGIPGKLCYDTEAQAMAKKIELEKQGQKVILSK